MSYKLGQQNKVQIVESGAWIPVRFEDGKVVALDEYSQAVKDFAAWVDAGNIPIPADKPDPRAAILAQLAQIDSATGSVRWIRELALGVNAAWDMQRELQPDLPLPGTGMAKVQQIEDQAAALRKQLAALG